MGRYNSFNNNIISNKNIIKLCFIDTETTGVDPKINGIHQLSLIMVLYDFSTGERREIEKLNLRMKPFEGCVYDEEALKVSEISKEEIETFQSEKDAFVQFKSILDKHCSKFDKKDKYYFVGYNAQFDKDMCYSWFLRNGEKYFFSYFFSNHIDVMTFITPMFFGTRPEMLNFKLGTVSKILGVETNDNNLHDAMYDIEITQKIFWKIFDIYLSNLKNVLSENMIEKYYQKSNTEKYNYPLKDVLEKQKILKYDSVLTFGKYKGKTVKEISEENANYLLWIDNEIIKDYQLDNDIKEEIKNLSEKQSSEFHKKLKDNTYNSYM